MNSPSQDPPARNSGTSESNEPSSAGNLASGSLAPPISLEVLRHRIGHDAMAGATRSFWQDFETHAPEAIVRALAEELASRKATITDYFFAVVHSGSRSMRANLHYMDYYRIVQSERVGGDSIAVGPTPNDNDYVFPTSVPAAIDSSYGHQHRRSGQAPKDSSSK
jgi:hypothetical protein